MPLSAPGVVAGTLLTFIPAAGDYVNAEFLGGASNRMIGNVIQSLYLNQSDYPSAAALSFVLMALIMIVVMIYIRFAGSEALMGEEADAGMSAARERRDRAPAPGAGCASTRSTSSASLVVALPAGPDRGHLRLLLQQPGRAATTSPGSASP